MHVPNKPCCSTNKGPLIQLIQRKGESFCTLYTCLDRSVKDSAGSHRSQQDHNLKACPAGGKGELIWRPKVAT